VTTAANSATNPIYAGVDTHKSTHTCALVSPDGQHLATKTFGTDARGLTALLEWTEPHGQVLVWGVECTGSYGHGLAVGLTTTGHAVVDVRAPIAGLRGRPGKDDPSDALSAARQVAGSWQGGVTPAKVRTDQVEQLSWLIVLRDQHVQAAATGRVRLKGLLVGVPAQLRDSVSALKSDALVRTCSKWRPPAASTSLVDAAKRVLRDLAQIILDADQAADSLERQLAVLVNLVCPALLDVTGIGPVGAAVVLTATHYAGPDTVPTDGQLASLAGVAPIPVSSGQRDRHRLNRGGNRHLNAVIHRMVLTQIRHGPAVKAWIDTKASQVGKTRKDAIRASKRHATRTIRRALLTPFTTTAATTGEMTAAA
jgi:transposase